MDFRHVVATALDETLLGQPLLEVLPLTVGVPASSLLAHRCKGAAEVRVWVAYSGALPARSRNTRGAATCEGLRLCIVPIYTPFF